MQSTRLRTRRQTNGDNHSSVLILAQGVTDINKI